jgi:hypothetical protein
VQQDEVVEYDVSVVGPAGDFDPESLRRSAMNRWCFTPPTLSHPARSVFLSTSQNSSSHPFITSLVFSSHFSTLSLVTPSCQPSDIGAPPCSASYPMTGARAPTSLSSANSTRDG